MMSLPSGGGSPRPLSRPRRGAQRLPRPGLTAAGRNVFPGRGECGGARPVPSPATPDCPSAARRRGGRDGGERGARSEARRPPPAALCRAQPGPARSRDAGAEGEPQSVSRAGRSAPPARSQPCRGHGRGSGRTGRRLKPAGSGLSGARPARGASCRARSPVSGRARWVVRGTGRRARLPAARPPAREFAGRTRGLPPSRGAGCSASVPGGGGGRLTSCRSCPGARAVCLSGTGDAGGREGVGPSLRLPVAAGRRPRASRAGGGQPGLCPPGARPCPALPGQRPPPSLCTKVGTCSGAPRRAALCRPEVPGKGQH